MSIYMIFLLLLGLGLFISESWGKRADYAIKLAVLVITLCYAIEELDQIIKWVFLLLIIIVYTYS